MANNRLVGPVLAVAAALSPAVAQAERPNPQEQLVSALRDCEDRLGDLRKRSAEEAMQLVCDADMAVGKGCTGEENAPSFLEIVNCNSGEDFNRPLPECLSIVAYEARQPSSAKLPAGKPAAVAAKAPVRGGVLARVRECQSAVDLELGGLQQLDKVRAKLDESLDEALRLISATAATQNAQIEALGKADPKKPAEK